MLLQSIPNFDYKPFIEYYGGLGLFVICLIVIVWWLFKHQKKLTVSWNKERDLLISTHKETIQQIMKDHKEERAEYRQDLMTTQKDTTQAIVNNTSVLSKISSLIESMDKRLNN